MPGNRSRQYLHEPPSIRFVGQLHHRRKRVYRLHSPAKLTSGGSIPAFSAASAIKARILL